MFIELKRIRRAIAGTIVVLAVGSAQFAAGQTAGVPVAGPPILAPDTVDPGVFIDALLSRSTGGIVEIWGPLYDTKGATLLASFPVEDGRSRITAPTEPGTYRLRHRSARGSVLATMILDVSAWPVSLAADHPISFMTPMAVRWRGPAAPGDRLEIYDPGNDKVMAMIEAVGVPGDLTRTLIPGHNGYGQFQLRYVTARGIVLQTLSVSVYPPR